MSKEFYNYLAKRTIDFFNSYKIRIGEKFILKLDNIDEVENYYNEINSILTENNKKVIYKQMDDELFETLSFVANNSVQLVIIPQLDITNAYLTRLRNSVSEKCAIFIICFNPIDSIARGAESLKKEGMPFHRNSLVRDIESKIKKSNMSMGEKQILHFDLNNKKNSDTADKDSISSYADILSVLKKEHLDDDDFRNYGMFSDKEISTISFSDEASVKQRINENYKYFKMINNSLKYGNIDDDLQHDISKDLINNIKKADEPEKWDKGITFNDVINSAQKAEKHKEKLKITSIDIEADGKLLSENIDFFVRNERETEAGRRKCHILLFNKDKASKIKISVNISGSLGKTVSAFDDKRDESNTKAVTKGKKIMLGILHNDISINKVKIKCMERAEKFEISYCIINCDKTWLEEIIPYYLISSKGSKKMPKALIINCSSEELIFNRHGTETNKIHLESGINIYPNINEQCVLTIDSDSFNNDNSANVTVNIDGSALLMIFRPALSVSTIITGVKIEQQKLKNHKSFTYCGNNKMIFEAKEYNTRENLKQNIAVEEYIVNNRCLSCIISDNKIISNNIKISENILKAYNDFIDYFEMNNTLPSLAYYNDALSELAMEYLYAVIEEFDKIKEGSSLTNSNKELLKIGTVLYPFNEEIAFSALHPVNVAYQLYLTAENDDAEIREDILRKLNADNLIPFIHDNSGRLFRVYEQMHTPHWTYYCPAELKKYRNSRNFTANLIHEKIRNFCSYFSYLFNGASGNKIIINAVNMGDCRNLFMGIADYYKTEMKKNNLNMLSFVINVYDDNKIYNVFETLSDTAAIKNLLNEIDIKADSKDYFESEFINIIISKVEYYRKNKNDLKYDYCHLAFIEMDHETKEGYSNKYEIRSGTMLNGLTSGVTSMYSDENRSYRTGYGCKFNLAENSDSYLMKLTEYYNSLMLVFGTNNPYNSSEAICTYVDESETEMIHKTYDSSNWVVFIDPKVDLNFFKKDPKDVTIIHYSDQHTVSGGYDAITVTRRTKQYENILKEFLIKNNMFSGDNLQLEKIIDMFNAVNGDWMLKLISSKNNFSKEKISIQSAIKLALAFYKSPDIIWIPISLEEILRVSGSAGLSKNGELFSAKNLGYESGATSDDLLMFGAELKNGDVFVHLYPLEVKIGYKDSDETDKAERQIKQTRKILYENLISPINKESLQTKIYRNFIAQLAVISAEKLNLYKIWENQNWECIINTEVRGKLLNDDFIITDSLHNKIGDGIIISFKNGTYMRDVNKENSITAIRFLHSDGIDYILKSVDDIYSDIMNMSTVKKYLFENISEDINTTDNDNSELTEENVYDLPPSQTEFLNSLNTGNEYDNTNSIITENEADNKTEIIQEEDMSAENISDEIINTIDEQNDKIINTIDEQNTDNDTVPKKSPDGMKILFGSDIHSGEALYWYPNDTEKIMHPNTGIIGTMGTGKTQFTKSLILQLIREHHNNPGNMPLGILIFDYKGDYNKNKADFVESTNAKVYDLYHLPFNPFSITITENSRPMLPLHIANTFKDTLSRIYNLGVRQETALRDCIMQAYELKGIDKSDKTTWNRTPPVLDTVFKIYLDSENFKEDSLYSALSELHEFEIFESDAEKTIPLYNLIDGVTVINLSGYNTSIQNLIASITLDLFYSQMQANGHSIIDGKLRQLTKFILVDEADNILTVGCPTLKKILKEGREFGVGTILSTQFLKHFDTQDDDFAKYIFTWIVHNVADLSAKDIRNLFNTKNKAEEDKLFIEIKKLMKHHSIVKFGDSSNPNYIKDKAFWELIKNSDSTFSPEK